MATTFLTLGQASRNWHGIAVDIDGDVYATDYAPGNIYKRLGGVGDFNTLSQATKEWRSISVAPNGDVYATVSNDNIYLQTGGSGNFVSLAQTTRNWTTVACAPNGDVYAAAYGVDLFIRTGGVGNFVALSHGAINCRGMACAPNGDVYAAATGGDIYKRTGGTGPFVALGQTSRDWYCLCVAPNGDVYAAVNNGDIYRQEGGTGNFIALGESSFRAWRGLAADAYGGIYATASTNGIYYRAPRLFITAPSRSVISVPTQATLAIVDDAATFTVPYIQTASTLTATATVGAETLPSGGGVKFVLNEGLAGEVVQYSTGGSSPFSTNFTGLAKGTYTLDVYVVNSSNVVQGSYHDEAIGIGIGDIICAIGDSATSGWTSNSGGSGSATAVLDWTTAGSEHSTDNRNFRQYDPVDPGSGPLYFLGFAPRLNDLLTAAKGYPCFVMNEGCGGYTTGDIITRMGLTNFQNRMNALDPNVWLLHAGGNDAGYTLSKATVKANYNTIIAAIKSSYAGTADNIYLARPIYLRGYPDYDNPYNQSYGDAVDEIVAANTCQAGPDFYDWFFDHPEQQDTANDVHPNAAGYSSTADLWADILSGGAVEVVGAGGAVAGGKSTAENAAAVTGTAGAVSGGTSTVAETTTATGASGAIAGGASVATSETTVTGTGGAVVGGEATVETPQDNGLEFEATGGAVSGGASTVDAAQSTLGASGAVAGGSSTVASGTSVTGAAGAVAGGESETSTPQPGPLEFVASGGVVLGGSSVVSSARTTAGESGAFAGGLATVSQATASTATGGVVSGGYAAAQSSTTVSGVVGAVSGGYAYVAPASEVTGSAGAVLGGESTVVAPENGPLVFDATGGAVSGGTSDVSAALSILAAGGAVLGGVSLVIIGIPVNAVWASATVKADGNIKGTAKADGNIKGTISA